MKSASGQGAAGVYLHTATDPPSTRALSTFETETAPDERLFDKHIDRAEVPVGDGRGSLPGGGGGG